MKSHEREEARRLRREEGLSVLQIARKLNVSKSSVSLWVRDIELTEAQITYLIENQHLKVNQIKAREVNITKHREIRRQYQEEGRAKARERDPLHIAGCMLYWAEGRKAKNQLALNNADPDMLHFYARFLRVSLGVQNHEMVVHINCYTNNGLALHEIESYWIQLLGLSDNNLRKTIDNHQPRSSDQKGRKLSYGVCMLSVYDTRLVQHVYGAIQEYIGVDKPEWLR
jgi:transcriptional regulator with XRE-family HTH domain